MKVLAFAASSSRESINKMLVTFAADLLKKERNDISEVEVIDLNDFEMQIFSVDREKEGGVPEQAHLFYEKIGEADIILISYAEHNGTYTAAFKNLFDWTSRIDMKVYQGKPVVLLSTSPGPGGASSVLASAEQSAPFFDARVAGSLSVPSFNENFDVDKGVITNQGILGKLKAIFKNLP